MLKLAGDSNWVKESFCIASKSLSPTLPNLSYYQISVHVSCFLLVSLIYYHLIYKNSIYFIHSLHLCY